MRLARIPVRELGLAIAVVLVAAGLFYLWRQVQSASGDLADARDRLAGLQEYAGEERLQELQAEVEQARASTTPNPFPTREEVIHSIALLRDAMRESQLSLTSFTMGETSATPGSTTSGEAGITYPGVALTLGAVGSSDALLNLLEKMQEQLAGVLFQEVKLTSQEEGGLRLSVKAVLYYQSVEATP